MTLADDNFMAIISMCLYIGVYFSALFGMVSLRDPFKGCW